MADHIAAVANVTALQWNSPGLAPGFCWEEAWSTHLRASSCAHDCRSRSRPYAAWKGSACRSRALARSRQGMILQK